MQGGAIGGSLHDYTVVRDTAETDASLTAAGGSLFATASRLLAKHTRRCESASAKSASVTFGEEGIDGLLQLRLRNALGRSAVASQAGSSAMLTETTTRDVTLSPWVTLACALLDGSRLWATPYQADQRSTVSQRSTLVSNCSLRTAAAPFALSVLEFGSAERAALAKLRSAAVPELSPGLDIVATVNDAATVLTPLRSFLVRLKATVLLCEHVKSEWVAGRSTGKQLLSRLKAYVPLLCEHVEIITRLGFHKIATLDNIFKNDIKNVAEQTLEAGVYIITNVVDNYSGRSIHDQQKRTLVDSVGSLQGCPRSLVELRERQLPSRPQKGTTSTTAIVLTELVRSGVIFTPAELLASVATATTDTVEVEDQRQRKLEAHKLLDSLGQSQSRATEGLVSPRAGGWQSPLRRGLGSRRNANNTANYADRANVSVGVEEYQLTPPHSPVRRRGSSSAAAAESDAVMEARAVLMEPEMLLLPLPAGVGIDDALASVLALTVTQLSADTTTHTLLSTQPESMSAETILALPRFVLAASAVAAILDTHVFSAFESLSLRCLNSIALFTTFCEDNIMSILCDKIRSASALGSVSQQGTEEEEELILPSLIDTAPLSAILETFHKLQSQLAHALLSPTVPVVFAPKHIALWHWLWRARNVDITNAPIAVTQSPVLRRCLAAAWRGASLLGGGASAAASVLVEQRAGVSTQSWAHSSNVRQWALCGHIDAAIST